MPNIHKLRASIDQSRSEYQIKKFVLGQHHTLEMQYVQLVRECSVLQDSYEEALLHIEKLYAEAEELRETGKKSDDIEAKIKEKQAASIKHGLEGTKREMEYMYKLLEIYPSFTREEIENAQEQYWKERLTRVAQMQAMGGGVSWAQIEALWQADALSKLTESNPIEELVKNKPLTISEGD